MATPQHDVIAALLFDRLLTQAGLTKHDIDFPDVSFTPPRARTTKGADEPTRYVAVSFTPNTSDLDGIAYDSGLNDTGLLGLNATCPAGQGVPPALQFVKQLVNAFQPGLVVRDAATGVEVRVHEQPRVAPPIEGTDNLVIPVIVRWVAATPKTGGY